MEMLDLRTFIPDQILCHNGNKYPLSVVDHGNDYHISDVTIVSNHTNKVVGKKRFEYSIPKQIPLEAEDFEVIGLLQGEMNKTHRRVLTFANCEPKLLNHVLRWFFSRFNVEYREWRWYVRLNVQEPKEAIVKLYHEQEVLTFWMDNALVNYYKQNPTLISYVNKATHTELQNYGTVMIEHGVPIFIQVIQKLVHDITHSMPERPREQIIAYMRGIIAAEATVNFTQATAHYRVFITATVEEERQVFIKCLSRLSIETYDCKAIRTIVISRRENILRLQELDLMTLNPDKELTFHHMVNTFRGRWPKLS